MTMKPMQNIFDGYLDKFKQRMDERREKIALPVRPRNKKTRLWIDNEYFSEHYGKVLPLSALAIYAVLCKYANAKTQTCYPSVATIMRESGVKTEKTVFSSLKKLEYFRIIEISRSKGRSSNKYTLLASHIWLKPSPNPVMISGEHPQSLHPNPVTNATQSHISEINEKEIMGKEISLKKEGGSQI
jgi:hypothetical protein